jgi:hypothetical protein
MFWLESSSTGMNIVNVLKKRGNALSLFWPLFALRKLVSRTELTLYRMARANLGQETSWIPPVTMIRSKKHARKVTKGALLRIGLVPELRGREIRQHTIRQDVAVAVIGSWGMS